VILGKGFALEKLEPRAGLAPAACCLRGSRSTGLSYRGIAKLLMFDMAAVFKSSAPEPINPNNPNTTNNNNNSDSLQKRLMSLNHQKLNHDSIIGTVKSLGEHQIIDCMRRHFDIMPDLVVPFGDDVSALTLTPKGGDVGVLKTDMLVGRTDVPCGMSLWQTARKAVVMNVSDFAAKGVQPQAVVVALGLPGNLTQTDVEEIAKGLNAGARQYGAYVVGGDTGEASDLVISVHLFGTSQKAYFPLRSGAQVGDIVAVTGAFGKSAAGLRILLDPYSKANHEISEHLRGVLVDAVLLPQARLHEGLALRGCGAVNAAIDSSDGLAWSLYELAKQSAVGFSITTLPVADEVKQFAQATGVVASDLALYGGEEYELVMTVNPKLWEKAQETVAAIGGKLLPIGKATRDKTVVLDLEGKKVPVEARGWEHFKSNP
jgi:thiamine-monophosphate kinase